MLLIPVMFLRGGMVLKPAGGAASPVKSDPIDLANSWVRAGTELIHIIDLDAPPAGISPNTNIFKKIHDELHLPFEIEGNIRTIETAEKYVQAGAVRLTLGAIAYQKPAFFSELCKHFPQKIGAHIDVKRGKVSIKGWTAAANKSALDYAVQFKDAGAAAIYLSDVEEEGTITVVDAGRMKEFLKKVNLPVFNTTDISSTNDLEQLIMLESYGLSGTLLSKSIYEGRVDLEGAITFAKERSTSGLDEPTLQSV